MDIYTRAGTVIGKVTAIDATPTENSTNAVQSGGVYTAIEEIPTGGDSVITKTPKNLIDVSKTVSGTLDASGNVIASDSYYVSDYIPVDVNNTYISTQCGLFCSYDGNKTFISSVTINTTIYGSQNLNIPSNAQFIRLRIDASGLQTAICADVRYYTDGVTSGEEVTGVTADTITAVRNAIASYGKANSDQLASGKNLFDYEHDFVQVLSGSDMGLNANGSFRYMNDTLTPDDELPSNATVSMDKYFPVEHGQMIVCNKYVTRVAFYDSEKTFISTTQNMRGNNGIEAPVNCAFARLSLTATNNTAAGDGKITSLSQIKDIIVWTVPVIGSNDLVPTFQYPQFPYQIDGNSISPNYLDKVIPNMVESQFLSAMRCMAIREINQRDHAWRFGNFNMWVMASTKGWDMTKKMLMDYGVDFCGFEECVINFSTSLHKGIAEFLHGWQFPSGFYTNWTDGAETQIDKSFVSRFPVTSSAKLSFASASSNASYLNCKVQLPRYQDAYEAFKVLSVYVVHFPITTQQEKVAVATELLSVIANDTSDFVVIMGDTNDFGTTDETKDYWVTLEAGGFKPTIPITTKTVTEDGFERESAWAGHCIDQFLVSDNIEMVSYGVVNTKDEYAVSTISGAGTNNEPALSDHDFVYVDLKFDYNKVRSGLAQAGGE